MPPKRRFAPPVQIRLRPAAQAYLNARAADLGHPATDLIRAAVDEWIERDLDGMGADLRRQLRRAGLTEHDLGQLERSL